MNHRDPTKCRDCGAHVFWCTIDGQRVQLDARAPVFHRIKDPDNGGHFWIQDPRDERTALVQHRYVCPATLAAPASA